MSEGIKAGRIAPREMLGIAGAGVRLALSRPCLPYILVPVLVNALLLALGGLWMFSYLGGLVTTPLASCLPECLSFIASLISLAIAALLIFVGCYLFSTLATIIASPFYGALAAVAERELLGHPPVQTTLWQDLGDVPRIMARELRKQAFFWPWALFIALLWFIPAIDLLVPLLWFLLSSFMGCLQFCDYAYDNHKVPFARMKSDLREHLPTTLIFGASVSLLMVIPLANLLLPPVAVCAGVAYYARMGAPQGASAVSGVGS